MTVGTGPLQGVKVVELAGIGPGPFAATMLAELGADVVRVDRPTEAGENLPVTFDLLRRSRSSVRVDLRSDEGREQVLRLVELADVLIEGNRPGVTERLGLGPDACWARNPRLVYARMTGWGQEGPAAHTAGHDLTYLAVSGALHPIGSAGGPPVIPVNLLGDFGGGALYLVAGVLAALWEAARSGRGQVVDAAIVDGAASLTLLLHGMTSAGLWSTERGTNLLDGGVPWYDVYKTKDGGWMAVAALEPKFFAEFCRLLPLDADESDRGEPARFARLRKRIEERFLQRTRQEWTDHFLDTDACVAPVLSLVEAGDHPHLAARSTYVDVAGIRQPAPAPRFSRTPTRINCAPTEETVSINSVATAWQR
jgi:alpha-methylacyl-CoA racemase